jgi:hypothetical protein
MGARRTRPGAARRLAAIAAAAFATVVAPAAAEACVEVGAYQDAPATAFAPLRSAVGSRLGVLSIYVGPNERVPTSTVALVRRLHLRLIVAWEPDDGRATPTKGTLAAVVGGRYDAGLRRLVAQLRGLRPAAILRPLPEANTPWHGWSGTVRGNTPSRYRAAWKHVRAVVRKARGGRSIRLLWSPYARSIPDTATNEIRDYFPGSAAVDLVGATGYNFGATTDLDWSLPQTVFQEAYDTIEALARRPFWIAETGSTAVGGDKAAWVDQLGALPETMPRLAGIVWFDAASADGDFRVRETPETTRSFHALVAKACR